MFFSIENYYVAVSRHRLFERNLDKNVVKITSYLHRRIAWVTKGTEGIPVPLIPYVPSWQLWGMLSPLR